MTGHRGSVHTASNAVPLLDGDLAEVLDDLSGAHPAIDMIRDGIRSLAQAPLSKSETQTVLYTLAGAEGLDVLTALASLVRRLTSPDTNPALRDLPFDQADELRAIAKIHAHEMDHFDRQPIADAIGLIDREN